MDSDLATTFWNTRKHAPPGSRYATLGSLTYQTDMFAVKDIAPPPSISEHTYSHSSPGEWAGRIQNMTLVHTGGGTDMAFTTHHTFARPKFPVGSIRLGMYTLSQYLPKEDPAIEELHRACDLVHPYLEELIKSLDSYHLHCEDGWITSAGFVTCASKVGLRLTRGDFLALERSVPKDTMGRINYNHVIFLVASIANIHEQDPTNLTATAPEAVADLEMTVGTLRAKGFMQGPLSPGHKPQPYHPSTVLTLGGTSRPARIVS